MRCADAMLWKLSENSWIPADINLLPSLVSYAPVQCLFNEAGLEAMELDQVLNNWLQGSAAISLNIKETLAKLPIGKRFIDLIACRSAFSSRSVSFAGTSVQMQIFFLESTNAGMS